LSPSSERAFFMITALVHTVISVSSLNVTLA
jgi:hypothetical protein